MKRPCGWLFALTALLLALAGVHSPAMADWVDITGQFTLIQSGLPATDINVAAINNVIPEAFIEGELRLIFTPAAGTPLPVNALTAGEDGSEPKTYFPLSSAQEGVVEPEEILHAVMSFNGEVTESMKYTLAVEINSASINNEIFRKKISKTPELYSGEALIEVMPIYVTAQSTKGDKYTRSETGSLIQCGQVCDDLTGCEFIECGTDAHPYAQVKPLIVTYVQEEEETLFNSVPGYVDADGEDGSRYAHDVYAAVSLDDGLTWKRRNISRTSLKSSFILPNGVAYPGDSEDQDLTVVGPYVLVTWVDKYCRSGDPWDMEASGIEDLYTVTGSQKSVDYLDVTGDEEPRPDLGTRPFSCLWGARGVLDQNEFLENGEANPSFGTIVWYKSEQLSSGRRDAKHNFNAAIEPIERNGIPVDGTGGFAVSWQEDPKGLKTGKGRGPGVGMSGASVNHKTDVWYSFIKWNDFAAVDENFISNSSGDSIEDGDGSPGAEYFCTQCPYVYDPELGDEEHGILAGTAFIDLPADWKCPICGAAKDIFEKDAKPHALHHFTPPVPVTDNAVCRERIPTPIYGHKHVSSVTDCDYYYEGGTTNQPLLWADLPADWQCPQCGRTKDSFNEEAEWIKDRHESGEYCSRFAANPRVDGDGNVVSPEDGDAYFLAYYTTDQGVPLDGNTGASRANLSLVNWMGQTIALMAYEETKGVGVGSDKVAAAMEQPTPYPLVDMGDGTWEAGAVNSDCRSCHYQNVVPRNRMIPMATEAACLAKGGTWDTAQTGYFPYTGYPFLTDDPATDEELMAAGVSTVNPLNGQDQCVHCVKFYKGRAIYPRDWDRIDLMAYYTLPDHMPGWHQEALDCTSCHLPTNTKDWDEDGVIDRNDLCPGTPPGEAVDNTMGSPTCGCSASQDPNDPDDDQHVDRYRHGKNVYYHHFPFDLPETIAHGAQVNGLSRDTIDPDSDTLWKAPGSHDPYENARRVMVVPNELLDENNLSGITLGLLYKEGKDGQGAPADAIIRLFKGGFEFDKMGPPLNISSATPYLFQDPLLAGNEEGSGDRPAGDGTADLLPNRNTPKIDYYFWTDQNLQDSTGYWFKGPDGGKRFRIDGYTPELSGNPFENVYSTRLSIHGDTVLAGFAYCGNWSAGKNAKDHYDFFVRVSQDAGATWTLPVNVSQLKNHEETVSDCRAHLTPPSIEVWGLNGARIPFSQQGAPAMAAVGDFNRMNTFFVGIGTKQNIPQPHADEDAFEETEIFHDAYYAQGRIAAEGIAFETYTKENPKYVEGSLPFIDPHGNPTGDEYFEDDSGLHIPNQPNPAYPKEVNEFNWLAKGDAHQGDVQMTCNPMGSQLYALWEQELVITDEDGQKHFQGTDVWFRKVFYEEPSPKLDVDQNGVTDWEDGRLIIRRIGTTAYEQDFLWSGDFFADHRISGQDYSIWKKEFDIYQSSKLRKQWTAQ